MTGQLLIRLKECTRPQIQLSQLQSLDEGCLVDKLNLKILLQLLLEAVL